MALILVVDDLAAMRNVMATTFRMLLDAEVIEAESADAALRWAREVSLSLVVTDVEMPGMDGCALAEALRTDPRTARVPIVAVSASDHRREARAAGCDAFLAKPFRPRELAELARRMMSQAVAQTA